MDAPDITNLNNIDTENTTDKDIVQMHSYDTLNVSTEPEPSTSTPKTPNQSSIKDDWSSLLFSSDDSLFDEMTRQLEDDKMIDTNKKKKLTSTVTTMSTSTQEQETLLDIVFSNKTNDAVTGLQMLGSDLKDLDAEIENEQIMPIDKTKQVDISKSDTLPDSSERIKHKKKKRNCEQLDSPRRSSRITNKPVESESADHARKSSSKITKSPKGILKVTCYQLRKGSPNKYKHWPLKCSMCDQQVNSKDELRVHHQEVYNIITCKECRKGFTTNQSLRKHSYTHTTKHTYECLRCKQ